MQIDRAPRGSDIKGPRVVVTQASDVVCPDLIGHITVARDPIGTDNCKIDLALGEQASRRAVCNHGHLDPVFLQLPRSKSGSLQPGARLVGDHADLLSGITSCSNYAKCRSISARSQSACVTVRQNDLAVRYELGAKPPHAPICGDIGAAYLASLFCHRRNYFSSLVTCAASASRKHLVDGP